MDMPPDQMGGPNDQGGPQNQGGDSSQAGGRGQRGQRNGQNGQNSQDMQARQLASLKEQMGITADDEWNLIAERIAQVIELRRTTATSSGNGMMRGGAGGRTGRQGSTSNNAELTALQTAVNEKAPDAEVKSRLERLRETRKESTAKLEKAQEELRAVLSVRQEAILVINGLLP